MSLENSCLHNVLDLFKLVETGRLGGELECDFDLFIFRGRLDNLGLLLDPPDLVDIFLVLAPKCCFSDMDNQSALTLHLADTTNTTRCFLGSSHGGLALENTSQTILFFTRFLGD